MMMKLSSRLILMGCLFLSLAVGSAASAQEVQSKTQGDYDGFVFRISKSLIDQLTDDVIEAEIPFEARVLNSSVWGTALGRAELSIEMLSSGEKAEFLITAEGEATGCFNACHGKLNISGELSAAFTVKKWVLFDGQRFVNDKTLSNVDLKTTINQIDSQRIFPLRVVTQPLGTAGVKLLHQQAEEKAIPYAIQYLEEFVENEAEEVITELNETMPFEQSLHKLFPETKDWVYRLSADERYLQSVYGPRDVAVPVLPVLTDLPPDSGLEFWIQADSRDAKLLRRLAELNKQHQLMERLFPETDPILKKLIRDAVIIHAKPWLVLSVPVKEVQQSEEGE